MLKNIEELKLFIKWAKEHSITRIKLGEVEIDISPISYINSITDSPNFLEPANLTPEEEEIVNAKPVPSGASKTWTDTLAELSGREDPDLFHSVT
jgi:hypothetical protein